MPNVLLDVRLPELRAFQREAEGPLYYAAPTYLPSSATEASGPRCPVTGWYVVGPEAGLGYMGVSSSAAEYMARYLFAEMPQRR